MLVSIRPKALHSFELIAKTSTVIWIYNIVLYRIVSYRILLYPWWTRTERASAEFCAVWVCKECEEDGMNISSWNYFVVCAFRCCSCRILVYKKVVASLGRIASNMRGRQTRKCCFGVAKSDEEPGKRSSSSCTIGLLSNNSFIMLIEIKRRLDDVYCI